MGEEILAQNLLIPYDAVFQNLLIPYDAIFTTPVLIFEKTALWK